MATKMVRSFSGHASPLARLPVAGSWAMQLPTDMARSLLMRPPPWSGGDQNLGTAMVVEGSPGVDDVLEGPVLVEDAGGPLVLRHGGGRGAAGFAGGASCEVGPLPAGGSRLPRPPLSPPPLREPAPPWRR